MNASTSAFTVSDFQLIYPIPLSAIDAINDMSLFPQKPWVLKFIIIMS